MAFVHFSDRRARLLGSPKRKLREYVLICRPDSTVRDRRYRVVLRPSCRVAGKPEA